MLVQKMLYIIISLYSHRAQLQLQPHTRNRQPIDIPFTAAVAAAAAASTAAAATS
jgi:hypothetical protein